jgi:hypothetical protein
MKFLAEARQHKGVWVDVEKPFWYDTPVWLASGMVDSIGIAHNHMQRDGVYPGEAWGRPRDKQRLPDPRNSVLLVGFQAEGTRGRSLLEHAPTLRMHGQDVPVRAEIVELPQFSAHGDRNELTRWASGFASPPRQTFIVHGEPAASQALRDQFQTRFHWQITLPKYRESFELG